MINLAFYEKSWLENLPVIVLEVLRSEICFLLIKSSSPFNFRSSSWLASAMRDFAFYNKSMPTGPTSAKLSAWKRVTEAISSIDGNRK